MPRDRVSGPHRLDRVVGRVATAAVGNKATALGRLSAQWPEIAGRDLALKAVPERIRFPRGARDGGTLTLRVDTAHALAVSYDTARIIDRLNTHFGYPVVAAIKLVQGRLRPNAAPSVPPVRSLTESEKRAVADALESVTDPAIKARLETLGLSLYGRTSGAKRP